ncbi:MAG TPA: hypothetical protein VHO24_00480 [Opitutaceae bacterium]|nr:hypothetical protein [Opitutaceae bacterium]
MQRLLALGLFGLMILFSGCESLSDAREKLVARDEPRTRAYAADQRTTFDAARRAAEQMGYRFQRGGPAQGELEAISGIGSNDRLSSARQISMKVRLTSTLDGGTEVALLLKEIIEADSVQRAGQATATTLRDTPQYEVFFRTVQQVLDAGKNPAKP